MKKILITGFTGFLGSNLIDVFSKKYKLIGITHKKKSKQKIIQIQKNIRNLTINDIPNDIESIIHLAANSDIKFCNENPQKCYQTNVDGTLNMLELSRKLDTKFLFMSTSHVYGYSKKLPISENHPTESTSIYATSKLVSEKICESYAKLYGLDIPIIRLFSTYGPFEPNYKVTSEIISQLLVNDTITLGNIYPKRDFVYVGDVIRAMDIIIKKSNGFNIFNVGTGKSYSILEISKMLSKLMNKKLLLKSNSTKIRNNEISNVVADCSKIKKLGWMPKTTLLDGLKLTLNWHMHNKQVHKNKINL
jgi:nucleoside-diphosphate-sugar epimerase